MIKLRIKSTCPYCGTKNENLLDAHISGVKSHIVACDTEEGGCGSSYVTRVKCTHSYSVDVDIIKGEQELFMKQQESCTSL